LRQLGDFLFQFRKLLFHFRQHGNDSLYPEPEFVRDARGPGNDFSVGNKTEAATSKEVCGAESFSLDFLCLSL
jgi:hypothetical protein